MAAISTLHFEEQVRINSDRLAELYGQLGEAGAENVIGRAMEELAIRLAELAPLHRNGKTAELGKLARSLVAIADQIGLASLARVAGDVAFCANVADPMALGATLARLQRIGDVSLTSVWDMRDGTF